MALVVKDRVKQTTTTTGTGSIVLNGNVSGFQTFAAALTDGDTTYYGIFEPSTNEYEVGLGTWTESTATLARTTVLESSNSGSAVSLTAQAEVFITQPAEKAVFLNGSDVAELGDGLKIDSSSGSITITAEDGSGNIDVNLPRDNISPLSTITVTVANPGSGNKYYLDGGLQQTAILKPSVTYRFDQSDSSNSGHPLRFSTTSDGTHNSGTEFTTGVTTSGTPGSAGAYTEVRFEQDVAAKLYYYCTNHSGMGGAAETKSISTTGGAFTGAVTGTDLTLSGDLTVNGTTTTINTTNMVVSDALIELANGTTGTPANDAGLVIERGDSNNAFIGFDESADKFIVGTGSFTGASTGDLTITTGTLVANVEGNVTGNVTGDVTGNADTATALATGRTISLTGAVTGTSAAFDGSGNVSIATTATSDPTLTLSGDVTGSATFTNLGNATLSTTIAANSVALGTDTTGNYVATITAGTGISGSSSTEGGTPTIALAAAGAGAGTYGSTSNNTKIDTITLDAYGRVTAVATGTTGDIEGVTAGSGLTGGGSSGSVTLNVGAGTGVTVAADTVSIGQAVGTGNSPTFAGMTLNGTLTLGSNVINDVEDIYLRDKLFHDGDTNTYLGFGTDTVSLVTGGSGRLTANNSGIFIESALHEDYDALSGTSPTCDPNNGGAFSLTMTGNTTFTFGGTTSGYGTGFVLQLTGNGSTVTWPSSVKWAGGTAPDAPASGETDILVFHTRDGGTNWYGVLASDAAA